MVIPKKLYTVPSNNEAVASRPSVQLAISLLVAVVLQVAAVQPASQAEPRGASNGHDEAGTGNAQLELHAPIWIWCDAAFTPENGVVGGTGTATDPYMIAGWDIPAGNLAGIRIQDTSAHFVITDCHIHGNATSPGSGISLSNTTNGKICHDYICGNKNGIMVISASTMARWANMEITNNSIVNNSDYGMIFPHILWRHAGYSIANNDISGNGIGISAICFWRNNITYNRFSNNKKFGIEIDMCMGGGGENHIHHNNFVDNGNGSYQCRDESDLEILSNFWNDTSEGNYWSDWTGPDANDDGIVDLPYEFNISAADHFPLAGPVPGTGAPPEKPVNQPATPDDQPPGIFDMFPSNSSIVEDRRPVIGANYYDRSGIDLTNISLNVDGVDVSANATASCSSIQFLPPAPLVEGNHIVRLAVPDNSRHHNTAVASWVFAITDRTPPSVIAFSPDNSSDLDESNLAVYAGFTDGYGIDMENISLIVDSIDVTDNSTVFSDSIRYLPPQPWSDGNHSVQLFVRDNSASHNIANKSWMFSIPDRTPPSVSGLVPADKSAVAGTSPFVSASFIDESGIDIQRILLLLDNDDVTAESGISGRAITYTPTGPLTAGNHTVYLRISDLSTSRNAVWTKWSFSVPPPANASPPERRDRPDNTQTTPSAGLLGLLLALAIMVSIRAHSIRTGR